MQNEKNIHLEHVEIHYLPWGGTDKKWNGPMYHARVDMYQEHTLTLRILAMYKSKTAKMSIWTCFFFNFDILGDIMALQNHNAPKTLSL